MASGIPIEQVDADDLFLDHLPAATSRAFKYFTASPLLLDSDWYLAGGTALALQVGHRQSVDLDFFTPRSDFNAESLIGPLVETDRWDTTLQEKGTIYGNFQQAKVSFIAYPFFHPHKKLYCGNVRILTPEDIAVMKIIAISQRGRKRDFVDLYWYCTNREPIEQIIERVADQYPTKQHNLPHILKSLVYFADAESDPMPQLFFEADWQTVKAYFQKELTRTAKNLLT